MMIIIVHGLMYTYIHPSDYRSLNVYTMGYTPQKQTDNVKAAMCLYIHGGHTYIHT